MRRFLTILSFLLAAHGWAACRPGQARAGDAAPGPVAHPAGAARDTAAAAPDSAPVVGAPRTLSSKAARNYRMSPPTPKQREEARSLIERACAAQGGLKAYRALRGLDFTLLETEFKYAPGARLDPPRKSRVRLRLNQALGYRQDLDSSEVVACDGLRGAWHGWQGKVYSAATDSAYAYFVARTMTMWSVMPFGLLDSGVVAKHLGPVTIRGQEYEMVLLGVSDTTGATDNYFCFFEKATGKFRGFNFTMKQLGKDIPDLSAWYEDPVPVGGVQLASTQRFYKVGSDNMPEFDQVIHQTQKLEIKADGGPADSLFAPPAH